MRNSCEFPQKYWNYVKITRKECRVRYPNAVDAVFGIHMSKLWHNFQDSLWIIWCTNALALLITKTIRAVYWFIIIRAAKTSKKIFNLVKFAPSMFNVWKEIKNDRKWTSLHVFIPLFSFLFAKWKRKLQISFSHFRIFRIITALVRANCRKSKKCSYGKRLNACTKHHKHKVTCISWSCAHSAHTYRRKSLPNINIETTTHPFRFISLL